LNPLDFLPLPRPDLVATDILRVLGPLGLVVAILIAGYVTFGPLVHSLLLTVFTFVCTQTWIGGGMLQYFGFKLRWTLVTVLFIRGVLLVIRQRSPAGESQTARRLVFALAGLAIASTLWSETPSFTLKLASSFCVGMFVTFGLLWRLADDPDVMRPVSRGAVWFALITMGGGFALAAYAWVTSSWTTLWLTKLDSGERYQGIFYNPNSAGVLGAMLLPIIIAAPREMLGRVARIRLPVCAITAATIFLSGSRSALIGAAMAIVILSMYRYGVTAFFTVALGTIAVSALALYAPLDDLDTSPIGHIARTKHLSTLSGRVELWEQGLAEAKDDLLLGQGWGHSRDISGEVDLDKAELTGHVSGATNLHNAHLQLLIDVGFVGVALFWAFCVAVLRAGWVVLRAPHSPQNGLALVLFTSALALMADTWVHGSIWSIGNPTTLAFWGLCVMTLKQAGRIRAEARAWDEAAPRVREPVAISLPE
jgi:exopolysaccharide production protein ExoQ